MEESPFDSDQVLKARFNIPASAVIHRIPGLKERWNHRLSVEDFIRTARDLISDARFDDPCQAHVMIPAYVESLVANFLNLLEQGLLDEAAPNLTSLPILYSTQMGQGASKWLSAKQLFQEKGVATRALCSRRGSSPASARNQVWGELAECSIRVAHDASKRLLELQPLLNNASELKEIQDKIPGAVKAVKKTLYKADDRTFVLLPSWSVRCDGLPDRVCDGVSKYQDAVKAIVDDFFADPNNPHAARFLKPFIADWTRSQAVTHVRSSVVKAAGRL